MHCCFYLSCQDPALIGFRVSQIFLCAFGFLSRQFYLILYLTKCNTKFCILFVLFQFFISVRCLLKKKRKEHLTDVYFYINRTRWTKPYDLALSLFLIKIAIGGGFRCIYLWCIFSLNTFFFSKHYYKVVLLFPMFLN